MVLALLLLACDPSEARFYTRVFELKCEKWSTCDPDDFAEHYPDADACFDALYAESGTYVAAYESQECTYDRDAAGACLRDLRRIDCAVWNDPDSSPESCFHVWRCD
jgi:hypothetical protein